MKVDQCKQEDLIMLCPSWCMACNSHIVHASVWHSVSFCLI